LCYSRHRRKIIVNTILYLIVIAQLGSSSYKEREKAYRWLRENPHKIIQVGLKFHSTEVRLRSAELFDLYCEHSVNKFGYMPMLDSAWYNSKEKTYHFKNEPKFLDKYDVKILKQILDNTYFEENSEPFGRYRSATKIWFLYLIRQGIEPKELNEIFEELWKNDLVYLKAINNQSYMQCLYLYISKGGI
jgi:hypothetical protein